MTNEEALEKMSNLAVTYSQIDADTCELFTIAKEALEKQVPIEHHHTRVVKLKIVEVTVANLHVYHHEDTETGMRESVCPCCLGVILTSEKEYPKFCTLCGQAIDWSDER